MEIKMSDDKVYYGAVVFFDNKKGYGFVTWDIDGVKQKDMFVHFSDINCEGYKSLFKDQKVSFNLGINKNNVPKATNVTVLNH